MSKKLLEVLETEGVDIKETIERFMGDEAMYEKYLIRFLDEKSMARLAKAVEEGEYEIAAEAIHTLKGVTDNLGFEAFVDIAVDMLYEFRHDNKEGAMELFPDIKEEYDRLCGIIRANKEVDSDSNS